VNRWVVTGSAGFIGSHLTTALRARGDEVVEVDRRAESPVDISRDQLNFAGADGVFHLAAKAGVVSYGDVFASYARDNVLGTQRVFEAAVSSRVRVVFVSSSSVYGRPTVVPTPESARTRPLSPYGITKATGELLAQAYAHELDLDVVTLRYFTVFGPGQRPDMLFSKACRCLRTGEALWLRGTGGASRGFTFVSDIVDATYTAMVKGEGTYNVGGDQEVHVRDALSFLEGLAGQRLSIAEVPAAPGEETRTLADTSRLRALGWKPSVSVEDGLRAQWAEVGSAE
jgi:UDP-glucuronate 4-epimerase